MMHANQAALDNCHAQKAGNQQKLAPQIESQPLQEKCICSPVLVSTAAFMSSAKLLAVLVPGLEEEAGPDISDSQLQKESRGSPLLAFAAALMLPAMLFCIGYESSAA